MQIEDLDKPSHADFIAYAERRVVGIDKFDVHELKEIKKQLETRMKDDSVEGEMKGRMGIALGKIQNQLVTVSALSKAVSTREEKRVASVDFDIKSSKMLDTGDLENFLRAINSLFEWFDGKKEEYFAPYLPLVQSSGTGKTKLLHEANMAYLDDKDDSTSCMMFLCQKGQISVDTHVFPHLLDVSASPSDAVRKDVWNFLEGFVDKDKKNVFFMSLSI